MLQGAVLPASDLISHFMQKAGVIQCMQFAPMSQFCDVSICAMVAHLCKHSEAEAVGA
jgi:hypothetical protein